jgi:hypothetical protein
MSDQERPPAALIRSTSSAALAPQTRSSLSTSRLTVRLPAADPRPDHSSPPCRLGFALQPPLLLGTSMQRSCS